MSNSFTRFVDALRDAGCYVEERGDRATAQAPGHSGADRSINLLYNVAEGRTAFMSFADDKEDVLDALGLTWPDLFDNPSGSRYEYGDGRVVHRRTGQGPNRREAKNFHQAGNTTGNELFHAERLWDAETVYFVDGEHDVLVLEQEGVVATCAAGGGGNSHLADLAPLHGKHVIVIEDNDGEGGAGERQAAKVVNLLNGKASVEVVQAAVGKDAADHITAGRSVAEFIPSTSKPVVFALLGCELTAASEMDLDAGLGRMRSALSRVVPQGTGDQLHVMKDLIEQWWDWFEKPASANRIIPTPWPKLNEVLAGGLHTGRSYLIAARPGVGKSLWLSNFGQYAAQFGHPGLLYSVEMGRMEVTSRILASGAQASYTEITARRMSADNLEKVANYVGRIQDAPLYMSDRSSIGMPQIIAEAGKLKSDTGLDFVGIDYAQLLKARGHNRQEAVSEVSRQIKILAGELDVAMVSACQLNRGNAKEGRKPVLSDLRESGSWEQDADVVILLHLPTYPLTGEPTGDIELIIAKNRTGKANVTVTLPWRPWVARIGE